MSHRSRHPITRREALCRIGNGFGMMAFAGLIGDSVARAAAAGLDHPARAKHVIFLFMNGGPSQVDTFDYKPELVKNNDKPCPESLVKGKTFAFTSGIPKLLGTPHEFKRCGQSGAQCKRI